MDSFTPYSRFRDLLIAPYDGLRYEFSVNFEKGAPMSISTSVSNQISTDELPRPDGASTETIAIALPRPLPRVTDSGRISFGAGLRILTK